MRNPLNKTLRKDLKENMARYLSISIIMVVMIAVISGFLSVAYGCQDILKENQAECMVEDGQFALTQKLDEETRQKLKENDVQIYESFYSEQKINDDTIVRVYENRDQINLAAVHEGELPNMDHEIALDRLFAAKNDLKINDIITIDDIDMTVVGMISVPDYSSLIEKNSDIMMDPIHFGIAVVNSNTLSQLSQSSVTYSYSYLNHDNDLSEKENYDVLLSLRDTLYSRGYIMTNMMSAQMNQAISFLPNDMGSDIPMMQILFYIILTILAFIFVVISQAVIEDQSAVIGTLLASGYRRRELVQHYMMIPMIIVLISALVGNLLGYTLIPPLFTQMYYNSYSLPPFQIRIIPEAVISTTLVPVVSMFLINFIMLSHKLKLSPLRFLRKNIHKQRRHSYIHLHETSFMKRFRTRVILQNKGSYLILFVGIVFASFLFTFGFSLSPSIDQYLEHAKESIQVPYQYVFKGPVDTMGKEKITVTSLETYFEKGDLDLEVNFYGLPSQSAFYQDLVLPEQENEITISYDLAQKMSLKIKDQVKFKNPYTEKTYELTVANIFDYRAGFSVFMPQKYLNQLLEQEESYYNGCFSDIELDIDETYIQNVITANDITKIGEQMTDTFSQIIPILLSVSVLIYMIVMYILTKLVIDRNAIHMSFLKVMGYHNKEIRKLYMSATTSVVILSLLASIPICIVGLDYLITVAFMKFTGYLELYVPYYVMVSMAAAGLFSYFLVNVLLTSHIKKLDLGESLKDMD